MTKKGKLTLDRLEIENPFEKVTVEQFNDDYSLIAYLFAKPKPWEFCISELDALSSEKGDLYYGTDKIGTKYKIRNTGREVNLIADGYPINFWATESISNEVSDLIMSLMFVCTVDVATNRSLPSGINQDIVNELAERYELTRIYLEYHSK